MTSRYKSIATVIASAAVVLFAGVQGLLAASFTYNNGDALLVFRQSGQPDLEVDIGPVSQFINAAPGSVTAFSQYNLTQLQTAYSNLGGLDWAVIGTVRSASVYSLPVNTLFLTNPRISPGTQTAPFTSLSTFQQGPIGSVIATVAGSGSSVGAIPWSAGTPASAISNTVDVVIIPASDASSYASIAGSAGDLAGNFNQGDIENLTPGTFTSGDTVSDLYELQPASGNPPGTYLGYLTFNANGVLTFTAAGSTTNTAPPVLVVTSPTDYEVFTNADILVEGTATDSNGIQGVTVNGVAAGVNGSDWSNAVTLAAGTNTITVIATDAGANLDTSTQVVHAVLSAPGSSAPGRDFAITRIIAPATVVLTSQKPSQTKVVLVEFENVGTNTVVISNLTGFVDLTVQTLGTNCPDAQVTLHNGPPQKKLPVTLKHKARLQVAFDVVFDCANDLLPSTHGHPHNDFRSLAQVGAGEDTNTVGNVCPRPPSGSDPGCGDVGTNHVLGADIFTDVVVKEGK